VALILLWTTSDVRKEKAMNGVREITEANFQNEVLASANPVLVDFYAPWCGPCRMLAPTLEGIATKYSGRIKVVKVNVDEATDLAAHYRIQGVPTLLIFHDGKPVDVMVGLPPAKTLLAKLDTVAASTKGAAA
jgi:thioredoxin 1